MKLFELFEATAAQRRAHQEALLAQRRARTEADKLEKERKEREEKNKAQIDTAQPTARQLAIQNQIAPVKALTPDEIRAKRQEEVDKLDPELQQFYDPGNEEGNGVYVRFATKPNSDKMIAYWTTKLGTGLESAKGFGTTETISTEDSSYSDLFAKLLKSNLYVHVIVDKKNKRDNPDRFKKIMHYLDNFSTDYLTGEFDNTDPAEPTAPRPSSKSIAATAPQGAGMPQAKIEASFVNLFKTHPSLSAKLAKVPKQDQQEVRADIYDIIKEYNGDAAAILPEVEEILKYALGS